MWGRRHLILESCPDAHCNSESHFYTFFFDELLQKWT